jgi:hypothetical protein
MLFSLLVLHLQLNRQFCRQVDQWVDSFVLLQGKRIEVKNVRILKTEITDFPLQHTPTLAHSRQLFLKLENPTHYYS